MRLPWSSANATVSTNPAQKRTVPGGLFSRFSFLRPAEPDSDDWLRQGDAPRSKTSIDDEDGTEIRSRVVSGRPRDDDGRHLAILQRTRKGSLRKSALLGGRRLGLDTKERRNPLREPLEDDVKQSDPTGDEHTVTRPIVDSLQDAAGATDGQDSESKTLQVDALGIPQAGRSRGTPGTQEQRNTPGYISTTEDDEEVLTFTRPLKPVAEAAALSPPIAITATSYFPPQPSRDRTRSARRLRPSPLQHVHAPAPEPYSYTETEYWGWVILVVTWLLFTVGMGSCLDIWSWAWDIGETPYAPPELEDDPTLPIVGYYPALIVLTGVVAWVWITVAWVGMKYFRHAKIEDIR
ncbi:hypothetical protein AMS68_001062 [Peltaster fructicola]|uniref:Uncharacterized protein n=1 Tax=Peltaster fructicola TaxID=286661 RepID=A0A6H0XLP0_9PEZI|nr:hypothetical protein AMS68_001062 [Peltaster fructicola]